MKVKIRDDYEGHHHRGRLVLPGEEIDVTPAQAEFLRTLGAVADPPKKKRQPKAEKDAASDEADITTEDESPSS